MIWSLLASLHLLQSGIMKQMVKPPLRKIPKFQLISWCRSFVGLLSFYTRELGESTVFYAVLWKIVLLCFKNTYNLISDQENSKILWKYLQDFIYNNLFLGKHVFCLWWWIKRAYQFIYLFRFILNYCLIIFLSHIVAKINWQIVRLINSHPLISGSFRDCKTLGGIHLRDP